MFAVVISSFHDHAWRLFEVGAVDAKGSFKSPFQYLLSVRQCQNMFVFYAILFFLKLIRPQGVDFVPI